MKRPFFIIFHTGVKGIHPTQKGKLVDSKRRID